MSRTLSRTLIKRAGRTAAVQSAIAWTAAQHIRAVRATSRWHTVGHPLAEAAWSGEAAVIVAFWHNRLMLMPYCWPSRQPFHMLISAHPDGRLIARTVAHFGIDAIAGSSTRGGGEAMRALLRKLKAGESVGITPDGPRGPAGRVGDGALALARLSGAAILPAAAAVSRRCVLNTWDHLVISLPFSRGALVWGEPLRVPRDADDATVAGLRQTLEGELNRVTALADTMVARHAAA